MNVYGVLNSENVHVDVSKTLRGAKRYATLNGFNEVSIRYNMGFVVEVVAVKLNGKWVTQ